MDKKNDTNLIILVVEDVHETRDGIERLLINRWLPLEITFRHPGSGQQPSS
jgi:hypothetical protein